MVRHFLSILFIFITIFGLFYGILNTPWLLSSIGPSLIEYYLPNIVEINSLKIDRQSFESPATIILKDIQCVFVIHDVEYQVDISAITLHEITTLVKEERKLKLSAKGVNVKSQLLKIVNATIEMALNLQRRPPQFSSLIKGDAIQIDEIPGEGFSANVKGAKKAVQILDIALKGFGGETFGQVIFEFYPAYNYELWLEASYLSCEALEKIHKPLFSGLKGKLNGTLRLIGDQEQVTLLDVMMKFEKGLKIKTDLLSALVNYISDDKQKAVIKSLSQVQGEIAFDKAFLQVGTMQGDKMALTVDLENRQRQVALKELIQVNLQEDLKDFILKRE